MEIKYTDELSFWVNLTSDEYTLLLAVTEVDHCSGNTKIIEAFREALEIVLTMKLKNRLEELHNE